MVDDFTVDMAVVTHFNRLPHAFCCISSNRGLLVIIGIDTPEKPGAMAKTH